MTPSIETAHKTTAPSTTLRVIEFDSNEGKIRIEIPQNSWKWLQIQRLLDEVFPLTTKWETTDSNDHNAVNESLARELYPYLPNGKVELRMIRDNAKRYFRMAYRGGKPEAKQALRPYILQLKALVLAVRQKVAVIFCQPNWRNWDLRAYRLFLELQSNLGKQRRVHFMTLTFTGDPTYRRVRELLKDVTGNRLYRQGFESVEVVAFHPEERLTGRLHVHLLFWSKQPRSLRAERTVIERFRTAVGRAQRGIGFTDHKEASGVAEILNVAAYMAWNYDQTLKQPKGPENPIPKGARVLSRPQNFLPGQAWTSTGKISLVTPSSTAWRKAVSRYAAAHGRSPAGDRRWIWRERRNIREYLEPETWWEASVTGLDGHTYRVIPAGEDHCGEETYLISSEERGGFYLTESGLEGLAKLQIAPEAFLKNDQLDLTTGKAAYCYEMLGMYAFM